MADALFVFPGFCGALSLSLKGACEGSGLCPFPNKKAALTDGFLIWLREQDLNLRPSGYEPDELPGCSIPRYFFVCPWRAARLVKVGLVPVGDTLMFRFDRKTALIWDKRSGAQRRQGRVAAGRSGRPRGAQPFRALRA